MLVRYGELPQTAFPAADEETVALLPLAAVESHGPHLPLGTDAIIADGIIDRAASLDVGRRQQVLRLPPLWLGSSAEHADRAGTLSQEAEPLIAQVVAIGEGLAHAGIRRMVLFNGHGGNVPAAAIAALRLRSRFGMLAASVHWLDFGLPEEIAEPAAEDVHGGWIETSMIMHLAPRLVVAEAVAANPPSAPSSALYPSRPVTWGWKSDDLAPGGWVGRPDLASVEKGSLLLDHAATRLVALLDQIARTPWPVRS